MTRCAYFECFSGASGDMILGALVDAGWPEADLRAALEAVPLGGWEARVANVKKGALRATQVTIRVTEPQPERDVRDIRPLIEAAHLPDAVKARAIQLFEVLAEVEGLEHDQPPETVHFHEVGAVDSILDIVGACAGLHALRIERLYVSPINVGGGIVPTRDGILPVPGPATLELLRRRGTPIYSSEYGPEFLTPTGALVLATLADGFGPFPPMRVERIGYGAGQKDFAIPNALRLAVGEEYERRAATVSGAAGRYLVPHNHAADDAGAYHAHGEHDHRSNQDQGHHDHHQHGDDHDEYGHVHGIVGSDDTVVQLETNVDDMSPEWHGYLAERLFAEGALDVTLSPIIMKKGRPGTQVSVLVTPEQVEPALATILNETTTLGVRIQPMLRRALERRIERVETAYGPIRVKLALLDGQARSTAPEYEDCRAASLRHQVALRTVYEAAQAAAGELIRPPRVASGAAATAE